MSKKLSVALILVGLGVVLGFQNCGGKALNSGQNGTQANTNLTVNGTIMKSNLDGCNYIICANDNSTGLTKCFIPQNIDPTLLNDGNVVTVDGTVLENTVTTCMAGSVLQVSTAKLVSGSTVPPVTGH